MMWQFSSDFNTQLLRLTIISNLFLRAFNYFINPFTYKQVFRTPGSNHTSSHVRKYKQWVIIFIIILNECLVCFCLMDKAENNLDLVVEK
jgi:hypothetical protein